jgi:pimeloyl-ACP methyl ester carboxylesterase
MLRAQIGLGEQREVLVDQLPDLRIPTLVVWGTRDRILPYSHAQETVARLKEGSLELIPERGHLPHVERPDHFATIFDRFLDEQAYR